MRTFFKNKSNVFLRSDAADARFCRAAASVFAANHNATAVRCCQYSMRNLSVLLSALDTSRMTRTALAIWLADRRRH